MRRPWLWWLAAVVLVLIGAGAVVMKPFGLDRWPSLAVTVAVVGVVAAVGSKPVQERLSRAGQRSDERRLQLTRGVVGGGRVVKKFTDPTVLGVHRSIGAEANTATGVVPYVRRDQHERVAKLLAEPGFVVIKGHSGSGKSRLAFEVLRCVRPESRLYAPEPTALESTIDELVTCSSAVLWLDDIERFLATGALSVTGIDRLLSTRGRNLVLGTVRGQASANLLGDSENREARTIFELAAIVEIDRRWSQTELNNARQYNDSRVIDALKHADEFGIAEYLAAGPQLLRRWHDGRTDHPLGGALVAAGVDLRRIGFLGPLPRQLLELVHHRYLDRRDRCESLGDAWQWSLDPAGLPTALLEPYAQTAELDEPVTVFDYLTDYMENAALHQHPDEELARLAFDYASVADFYSIGRYAHNHGRYGLAEAAYRNALILATNTLGDRHHNTLATRNNLASVLGDRGDFQKAEAEFRGVLTIYQETLGERHPDTLGVRNNLAVVLRHRGCLEEAEREHRAVLAIERETLGDRHPKTLGSQTNLALVLSARGDTTGAENEHRAALAIRREDLGDRHADTLSSRNNLASVLWSRGKLSQAEAEFRAVLALYQETVGEQHLGTLSTRNNLALVMRDRGYSQEAEAEFRAVRAMGEEIFGERHPLIVNSRGNLAMLLHARGELIQAEVEQRAVLAIQVETLGDQHPDTLKCRNNLALVMRDRGYPREAEAESRAVLAIQLETLGERHIDTLGSRSNLAIALIGRERLQEAEDEFRAVLAIQLETLGERHPDTLGTRNNLAATHAHRGHLRDAQDGFEAVLAIQVETLGDQHPDTLDTRHNLALVLQRRDRDGKPGAADPDESG